MSFGQVQVIPAEPLRGSEAIVRRLQQHPGNVYLLCGHSNAFAAGLMIGSATHQPIAVVDGAMKFNSYTLSRIASMLAIPPHVLLRRTYVTRSFTAFQTEAAITTKLPRFLELTHCHLVVVLGLLDAYYDEQVKPHECRHSIRRIMQTLHALTRQHIHTIIADVEVADPPPGKGSLFQLVHEAATTVISLQPNGDGFQLYERTNTCSQERSQRLWDATTIPSRFSSNATEKRGVNSVER